MVMLDTNRELQVTTKELQVTTIDYKVFDFRLGPSFRVFKFIRRDKYGKPDENVQSAVRIADMLGNGLEAIIDRGYLTPKEKRETIYDDALKYSESKPVKVKGEVIYQRILVMK